MTIDLTPFAWLFLAFLIAFMVFRFVALWYWRVNEIVGLLKKQNEHSARIIELLETSTGQAADPETIAQSVYRHIDDNLNMTLTN